MIQHGLGGDAQQVARIFPQNDRFNLTTIECAGHGRSTCPEPRAFSLESFYRDIDIYAAEHFPRGFVAGGISMGAALALTLAIRKPASIRALILVRPAWFLSKSPANLEAIRRVGELLQRYPRKEALGMFLESDLCRQIKETSQDNYNTLIDYLGDHQPEWVGKLLTDIAGDGFELSAEQFENIDVPTLIIGVEADEIHPLALAEQFHRHIPGSRFVKVPRKDDVLASPNYYDRTAELISGFLSEITEQSIGGAEGPPGEFPA
ncbi:alpha/beta fold hydrolase [Sinorhizobium meliloti]|uniref:Alpha/beta fold hydrolase n=1 Tax=Rhizobium meliloti TaxID=382 RepID=A0AAW9TLD0_RHIML|nr:alpha/beta fold hydrolase [Sinorhizobium meliloti]